MYPDNLSTAVSSTYEVIELDHSDEEEANHEYPDVSAFLAPMNDTSDDTPDDPYAQPDNIEEDSCTTAVRMRNSPPITTTTTNGEFKITLNAKVPVEHSQSPKRIKSDSGSPDSHRSSPLLTPMNATAAGTNQNGTGATKNGYLKKVTNGNTSTLSEITIQPLSLPTSSSSTKAEQGIAQFEDSMLNARKRNSTPNLQPTNDPIEMYCLSLVDCLRAMSRSERERVKFEFSKILKDAHYVDET